MWLSSVFGSIIYGMPLILILDTWFFHSRVSFIIAIRAVLCFYVFLCFYIYFCAASRVINDDDSSWVEIIVVSMIIAPDLESSRIFSLTYVAFFEDRKSWKWKREQQRSVACYGQLMNMLCNEPSTQHRVTSKTRALQWRRNFTGGAVDWTHSGSIMQWGHTPTFQKYPSGGRCCI